MKFTPQLDQMDCGPACLSMISNHYGKELSIQFFREKTYISREGISMLGIRQAAEQIGFNTIPLNLSLEKLKELVKSSRIPLPAIMHWNQSHFVILVDIKKRFFSQKLIFKVADPGYGFITLSEVKFRHSWIGSNDEGVALFIEPSPSFYTHLQVKKEKGSFKYIIKKILSSQKKLSVIFLSLLLTSLANLILPFLTQNMIDKGIGQKDLSYISLILLGQISLFVGISFFDILRNWITLSLGTQLNIQIISDFLEKMLKLPLKFFDSKLIGDLQQRIQDNSRIESFITSQSILITFSIVTFIVYFGILCYYDYKILLIYIILTLISLAWSFGWMKRRSIIDYFRFQEQSTSQSSIYEILNGVTEMKLNQFEDYKRKEWERVQNRIYSINKRILRIEQFQISGFDFINQLKNILVTFFTAYSVVKGNMTLGAMMSLSYIIGQMNSPVNQLITFFRSLQDARLSLERLHEVQKEPEEEKETDVELHKNDFTDSKGIEIKDLCFQYQGPASPFVLKNINLHIPNGKITAIVGSSGSGKTTLMKLLLKFYKPIAGNIYYNDKEINNISALSIRKNVGVVMQDGYIFSDTIERNIATGEKEINISRLNEAVQIANVKKFIEGLPLGYKTKIGISGNGLSGGQKQRILIARAIYRNPPYIFFDEATSALDAENEKKIHDRLYDFFKGRTVIVIAHRLSTVKNADQIVVLEEGKIVEIGKHDELVARRNKYYTLVKNQLELGT